MEGDFDSWPSYDYRPMPNRPYDQSQRDRDSQGSRSYEDDWHTIAAELSQRDSKGAKDLTMFNNIENNGDEPSVAPNMYPTPSIEGAHPSCDLPFEFGPPAASVPSQQPFFVSQPHQDFSQLQHQQLTSQTIRPWSLPYSSYHMPPTSDFSMSYSSGTNGGGYASAPPLTPNTPSPMLLGSPYMQSAINGQANTSRAFDDDCDDSESTDPCYAQLLYRALKEAPEHTMSLRDLYHWVSAHSHKGRDPKNKGWQNSVRHNLSMNHAFERVPAQPAHPTKKGSLWRLTDRALQEGVISTTRFRKDPKRKVERHGEKAPARVRSGAKGGQATRAATRRLQRERSFPYRSTPGNDREYMSAPQRQTFMDMTPPLTQGNFYNAQDQPYSSHPHSPYFYGQDCQLSTFPTSTSMPLNTTVASVSYDPTFRSAFDSTHHGLPLPALQYYDDYTHPNHSYPTPATIPGDSMDNDLDPVDYHDAPVSCLSDQDGYVCEQSSLMHNNGDIPFH